MKTSAIVKMATLGAALACFSSLVCLSSQAGVIYKSVDEAGNVRYSDQEPPDAGLFVEQIELPAYVSEPNEVNEQRLKRITETADRLKNDRLNREALKLKEQEIRQSLATPQYPETIIEERQYFNSTGYPYSNFYPRYHPRRHRNHHFQDFPRIHQPFQKRSLSDELRDSGPVIVPKSRLITP